MSEPTPVSGPLFDALVAFLSSPTGQALIAALITALITPKQPAAS
jgi:hypothetical protein